MIAPMLSKDTDHLPSGKEFLYEIKLDGQRTVAEVSKKGLLLYTRNFQNVTNKYPELQVLKTCINRKSAIVDGEIVALRDGVPSFELLQQRMNLRDTRAIQRAVEVTPILYYIFDILDLDGKSLLREPLTKRKSVLERSIQTCAEIKILPCFESRDLILKKAAEFGYEGVVAKKSNSLYHPGQRTDSWQKYKFQHTESFVIGGWIEGGRSQSFGSLLIGQFDGQRLIHCGRAGTGFNDKMIRVLMEKFLKLNSSRSPFVQVPRTSEIIHWLQPKLVAEVRFKEWTNAGIVRAPVFLGLREDLKPQDCICSSEFIR
jgi:bifunctional non-homologous end joining protein LigD